VYSLCVFNVCVCVSVPERKSECVCVFLCELLCEHERKESVCVCVRECRVYSSVCVCVGHCQLGHVSAVAHIVVARVFGHGVWRGGAQICVRCRFTISNK